MDRLRRKIDEYLINWKFDNNKKTLIVKINFVLQKQYKSIFDNGFEESYNMLTRK